MFNGKIHYKSPFSIAMLNYQRVCLELPTRDMSIRRSQTYLISMEIPSRTWGSWAVVFSQLFTARYRHILALKHQMKMQKKTQALFMRHVLSFVQLTPVYSYFFSLQLVLCFCHCSQQLLDSCAMSIFRSAWNQSTRLQCGAPQIAKLVYKSNNYGL